MSERDIRERDILVASNEYAYVQDLTKGDIVLYVGPTKISLSNTERIVDLRDGRFVPVRAEEGLGVSAFVTASSSEYVILENPLKDPSVRPVKGNNGAVELRVGRKVVVPGPATFPLWPGQRARVVEGHSLREDEYLIVRVVEPTDEDPRPIGTEFIVRGADTSFYLPRTGHEVVPRGGRSGRAALAPADYVREAHRLRKGMGIHLRVVKAFVDAGAGVLPARAFAAGEELFITEHEGFFFPTENLEILTEVFAVPLAEGEGLHVRDRVTGRVETIVGPVSYLPDPTKVEVMVRALDVEVANLWGVASRDPRRAIAVYVPSGFAVLVVSADKREVVRGPVTRVLSYEERLEALELSTGRPKTHALTLRTAFLQVDGNKVSDVVRLRTKDHIEIELSVSYRVSFVAAPGAEARWFHVTDYVGLMCDHLGSLLRAAARSVTLDRFHEDSTEILRAAVLGGKSSEGPRAGRHFDENGMWVYDVEILEVKILDAQVKDLIENAQRSAIVAELTRQSEARRLDNERLREEVNRGVLAARRATLEAASEHELAERALSEAKAASEVAVEREKRVGMADAEARALALRSEAQTAAAKREAELEEARLRARVAAFREQMEAMAPELVATLKTLGHQRLTEELTRHVAPLSILGGTSVTDVVERLLGQLPIGTSETVAGVLGATAKNGASSSKRP